MNIPLSLKKCTFSKLLLLLFILGSCFPAPEQNSNEALTKRVEQRNEAVRKYVRADLAVGQRYVDFGFGHERIIKPLSFKKLDSLYALYYQEEKKTGASDKILLGLKAEIENERQKVLKDTIHFLYEKPHFFGQINMDSTQISFADFTLDAKNKLIKVDFKYYFSTATRNNQFYRAYLNREAFLEIGYTPNYEEVKFYNYFDDMLNNLEYPDQKGRFLEHTLQIMRAANQQNNLNTESVIKQHVINTITVKVLSYKPIKWSKVYTNLDSKNNLISYEVEHEWSYKDSKEQMHHLKRLFVLNPYFEIIQVAEIDQVK